MEQPTILDLKNVTKQFSAHSTPAVDNVSLTLEQGDVLGLLGPSGCGKTTLLRIIAGFEQPSKGEIALAGRTVAGKGCWVPPELRNTGMVFQDYALFPHLTITENIAFGLQRKCARLSKSEIEQRIAEVLLLVGLTGLEKRYPHELSGGQQQRVALARALAPQPTLILLDEPLSNLDVQVRQYLRHEIRHILKAAGTSAIFVTHDQEEALSISDKIGVMRRGKLEQLGTPEEIYTCPASLFVAEFVKQANVLPAKRQGNTWQTEIGAWEIPSASELRGLDTGELTIAQEDIILKPDETSTIKICDRQFLGREYRYCLETASGKRLHARTAIDTQLPIGMRVRLSVSPEAARVFPSTAQTKPISEVISFH
ncbi:ABC transporter ATP-binding protein [Hydrococcus rivularis NIES-593]|uniref:ABC-type quaternary amine transporter n=1 Tax=Hydrococcus rivularis NIES-593 TaxID=1921803 RepID=A0A1U7HEQ8_9CYAN|nr:ABC transporter ATP-binding protein [Hydrococcus rivularis]OKH22044.1 ABC transporter ATP-binding protein [Hydrococcus rivularis NIES-593]